MSHPQEEIMDRHPCRTLLMKPPTLLFLLIVFLALIPSACPAQTKGGVPSASQYPTREEETIISQYNFWLSAKKQYGENSPAAQKIMRDLGDKLDLYERDGCKDYYGGKWKFRETGDEIDISFDDQYRLFNGRVTGIVSFDKNWVKIGYNLFWANFTKGWGISLFDIETLEKLRKRRDCTHRPIEGLEYSFKRQGNQMVSTTSPITIQPETRSMMIYQTGKKNYTLIRVP